MKLNSVAERSKKRRKERITHLLRNDSKIPVGDLRETRIDFTSHPDDKVFWFFLISPAKDHASITSDPIT